MYLHFVGVVCFAGHANSIAHSLEETCVVALFLERDPFGDAGPCQYVKAFRSPLHTSNLVQGVFSNYKMLGTGTTATKHTSMRWMTCWMRWSQCCSRMAWTSSLPAMCMPMSGFTAPTSACDHSFMFRAACLLYVTNIWTFTHVTGGIHSKSDMVPS